MKRLGQNRLEWALLGLIGIVCAGLSVLQYRWTGEVSRAERDRLRAAVDDRVSRLARAFNEEIRENCRVLLPNAEEIRDNGITEAHRHRYVQWESVHERNLFTRITVAVPEGGSLNLYQLDNAGTMIPIAWPVAWASLRSTMTRRAHGEEVFPSIPLDSTLLESPIFSDELHRGPRRELEWMIFEVKQDYLGNKVLPRLVSEYLNVGDEALYDVSIGWANHRGSDIFSTRADKQSIGSSADLTRGLFPAELGLAIARRPGRPPRDEDSPARWTIAVRHREGSLDRAVSRVRIRNLMTSLVLIALLAGAASALVRYTARSRRLSEMQFRFAVGVSHVLRTPLTAIRGAAFNLADGLVTEPSSVKRYSSLILRNAEELTSMIENVLAFSASMHGRMEEPRETFLIGDLVRHAAAAMTSEVEQAGCRLEVTVAPELPNMTGDPVALELAFRNLIANAARHAAQGRWIGVSAAPSNEGVEVRVSDRGPGIPEPERERIFDPFYRGEQSRAAQIRGTGLGLSLVKETVERHHGTITVRNSPAGGAQFTVLLPAVPKAA